VFRMRSIVTTAADRAEKNEPRTYVRSISLKITSYSAITRKTGGSISRKRLTIPSETSSSGISESENPRPLSFGARKSLTCFAASARLKATSSTDLMPPRVALRFRLKNILGISLRSIRSDRYLWRDRGDKHRGAANASAARRIRHLGMAAAARRREESEACDERIIAVCVVLGVNRVHCHVTPRNRDVGQLLIFKLACVSAAVIKMGRPKISERQRPRDRYLVRIIHEQRETDDRVSPASLAQVPS